MLTQEEIRIKAGLDYSRVTSGLNDIRGQVNKLANDVPKKLSGLLKANVYAAAASLIAEVLPSWQEIWDKVYNTGPESMAREEMLNKKLKDVVARVRSAKAEAADAVQEDYYKKAPINEQVEIVTTDLENAQAQITKSENEKQKFLDEQERLRFDINRLNEQKMDEGSGVFSRNIQAKARNLVIDKKILDLQEKVTKSKEAYAKSVELSSKAVIQEIALKEKLATLERKQLEYLDQPQQEDPGFGEALPEIANPMFQGVADYYKKVSDSFNQYGLKGEAEKYNAMSKAFYKAQADALKENVVNVNIKSTDL